MNLLSYSACKLNIRIETVETFFTQVLTEEIPRLVIPVACLSAQ